MKRISYYFMKGSENDGYYLKPGVSNEQARERIGLLEDILGDDYDLSRLRELVQADVAPVVHGTWFLRHIGHGHYWECSVCHATPIYVTNNTNYCPNCGAKMDMEQEEPTNGKQHDAE